MTFNGRSINQRTKFWRPFTENLMSQEENSYDIQYKIIILGDSNVGKTSIINRYCQGLFSEPDITIGVNFQQKFITMDGKKLKLAIWDTAGQEKYRTMTKSFYRNIQGVILVYDVTCPESLSNLEKFWIQELEASATNAYQVMLVANKIDLRESASEEFVSTQMGEEVARKHATLFVEASAKSAEGVQNAFEELVMRIMKEGQPTETQQSTTKNLTENNDASSDYYC